MRLSRLTLSESCLSLNCNRPLLVVRAIKSCRAHGFCLLRKLAVILVGDIEQRSSGARIAHLVGLGSRFFGSVAPIVSAPLRWHRASPRRAICPPRPRGARSYLLCRQPTRADPDTPAAIADASRETIAAVENRNIHRALVFHRYALAIPALVHAIGWRIAAGLRGRGDGHCNDCGALIRARWCPICRRRALPGFDKLVAEAPNRTLGLGKLVGFRLGINAHPHGMASCGSGRSSRRYLCCARCWCSRHRFSRRDRAPFLVAQPPR
jgi:hypothetical protein